MYNLAVAGRAWDRLRARRRRDKSDTPAGEDEDTVSLDDQTHSWWAAREDLEHGFVRRADKPREPQATGAAKSGFEQYFTAESLFTTDEQHEEAELVRTYQLLDPYVVLEIPETASWPEITAAHRRLAKLHHPDRLSSASSQDREQSERRMRELNIAYSDLRRRRGP